ncbi:unnamed protein product [Zymoseptoria tritici ST99CH_3D1]|uniref:Protein transport protein sec16 n=1 Tax=Zymoseptoria tritici ST99CH_1E4 TaxID=1276532 RepID=A0A2H1GZN2_ZYMTR|nr:unnamed protein product [Zymoseptoria tritici ST99CH_1E4]SMR62869.1 unnamed protein product [Zymoseptoria tritici ST99CH_3D1]
MDNNHMSTSTHTSWNPAFRPDSHAHLPTDTQSASDETRDDVEIVEHDVVPDEEVVERIPAEDSIAATQEIEQHVEAAAPEDVAAISEVSADVQGPVSQPESTSEQLADAEQLPQDEEAAIFQPEDTAQEQKIELEEKMPDSPIVAEPSAADLTDPTTSIPTEEDQTVETEQQGANYDYQGEVTQLEEAVDEAPSAPLLEDEELSPTVVEDMEVPPSMRVVSGQSSQDFDDTSAFGQPLPKAATEASSLDRSFTTNFTDLPAQESESVEEQKDEISTNDEWPAIGDDRTFGELLGSDVPAEIVQQNHPEEDDGWGATADDDAFGEILGAERSDVPLEEPAAAPVIETNASENEPEEDLAAMWQAALDDDELLEEPNDLDPSSFFGDDDDGFLEDEILAPAPPVPAVAAAKNPYTPVHSAPQTPQLNQNQFQGQFGHKSARSGGTPMTGLYDVYNHSSIPEQQQAPQRPSAQTAQSFADRSKGGYQSPYDLPMDVVKQPRQRPRQSLPNQPAPVPPPRSTSMSSQPGNSATPPVAGQAAVPAPPSSVNGAVAAKTVPRSASGFFEDLPMAPKPRTRPSGAYTPQLQSASTPGPPQMPPQQLPPQQLPRGQMPPPSRMASSTAPPMSAQQPVYGGFSQPERLPLLPDQPAVPGPGLMQPPPAPPQNQRYSPSLSATAQAQSRFSPAPPPSGAPSTSRYSPAPNAQAAAQANKYSAAPVPVTHAPPAPQQQHPFAPRTSSPLAYQTDKPHPSLPNEFQRNTYSRPSSPPTANALRSPINMSPERPASFNYSPIHSQTPATSGMGTPPRPKTQSPSTAMKSAKYSMTPNERPASTAAAPTTRAVTLSHRRQFSRDLAFVEPSDERSQDPLQRWKGHPIFKWGNSGVIVSSFPQQTPFYAAGHGIPSIKCTPGEVTVQAATTFMPMDDRNAKFPGPLSARAKGRKKDVMAWMSGKIEDLERNAELVRLDFQMDNDLKRRIEEKLVLWKIVRVFVENDGSLEGSPKIAEAVRPILLPNLADMAQAMDLQSPAGNSGVQADPIDKSVVVQLRQALLEGHREQAVWLAEEKKLWGHAMLIASTMGPETWKQIIQSFVRSQVKTVGNDGRSLAALYQVFAGNAEECVDELVPPSARAGFQMVSKSDGTVSGNPLDGLDHWRETLSLIAGNRTANDVQSLLALGKLLGGYGRAEAAHTCYMFARQVAKHTGADDPEVNFVLLGADHTSKTESYANDLDAIILTEIFEWASSLSAPSNTVVYIPHLQSFKLIHAGELAGSGLKNKAQQYCDHITSAYTSTSRPSQYYHPTFTQSVTDLSAFLSQTPQSGPQGLISKAAMNKVSSGAASWFTKFVSGDDDKDSAGAGAVGGNSDAMNGPFSRVAGGSPIVSRQASTTDLYNNYNPMSGSGLQSPSAPALPMASQPYQPSAAPSKYAPSSSGSSRYAPGGMSSMAADSHSRPASTRSARSYTPVQPGTQPLGVPRPANSRAVSDYAAVYNSDSRRGSGQHGNPGTSYEPMPQQPVDAGPYGYHPSNVAEEPAAEAEAELQETKQQDVEEEDAFARPANLHLGGDDVVEDAEGGGGYAPPSYGYQPSASNSPYNPENTSSGYEPPSTGGGYEPPSSASGYEPPSSSGGYEPPSSTGGYEPPSYQPYNPDQDEEEPPKPKKSMLDDDEDDTEELARRAAAMQKAAADRAADEAFRAAAEADAARDNKGSSSKDSLGGGGGEKKGWFGGWFKKDPNASGAQSPGPIRAKLGEENSFVYDETLKKWVDKKAKKDGSTPEPAAATPPPPRGPPSRAASGMAGPPMGFSAPPSRNVSGQVGSIAGSGPPSRVGTPAEGGMGMAMPPAVAALNGLGGGPPSRPASSMSNASSLDDLLGGPPGRKVGGTVKAKKKGGRYVDVMAK